MGRHAKVESTQSQYPWRAVARTAFAVVGGIAPMVPLLVDASGLPTSWPAVAGSVTIAAGITRVLSLPQVDAFLNQWVPWLSTSPRQQ